MCIRDRSNPPDTFTDRFFNIKETPDGGYLAVGTSRKADSTFQNGWAVKTDEWGCVEPGCQNVVISDCDGITPIENPQLEERKINVFPNPFGEKVTFDLEDTPTSEIIVTDISGKIVWQYVLSGETKIEWIPNKLEKGLYFYSIKYKDGSTQEGKLIYIQ